MPKIEIGSNIEIGPKTEIGPKNRNWTKMKLAQKSKWAQKSILEKFKKRLDEKRERIRAQCARKQNNDGSFYQK